MCQNNRKMLHMCIDVKHFAGILLYTMQKQLFEISIFTSLLIWCFFRIYLNEK